MDARAVVRMDLRRLALATVMLAVVLIAPITPTNAPFTVPNDVERLRSDDGLRFGGRGGAISSAPPEGLYTDLLAAGELSVELVLATDDLEQHGPARIVTMSEDIRDPNLMLGQELDALMVRLRTTDSDGTSSELRLRVPEVFATTEQRHVVITGDRRELRVYLDGRRVLRQPGSGIDLAAWDLDYPLVLGNEATGDRPWAGRLARLAFYDRALEPDAVARLRERETDRPSAAARYDLEAGSGSSIQDRRGGVPLTIPPRFRSGPAGPTWTVGDVGALEWLGVAVHVVAILGWTVAALAVVRRRAGQRVVRRIVVGLLVITGAIGLTTFVMWPRDDLPGDPDAVVVLGAAGLERALLGIELVERHGGQLVLSASAIDAGERLGLTCGREAICIQPEPVTTVGEARAVAALADEQGWDRVTVATSRFHTTRSRVLFRQCLEDQVSVVGTPRPDGRTLEVHLEEVVGTLGGLTVRRAC